MSTKDVLPYQNDVIDLGPLYGDEEAVLNDAKVSGSDCAEWRALLARPMTFLCPEKLNGGAAQKQWKNTSEMAFRWFFEKIRKGSLSQHLVRKKKGYFPVVFGAAAIGEGFTSRTAKGMKTVEMIGLDMDSGDSYEAALERVAQLGLACVAYTSFNDGATSTYLSKDAVQRVLKLDRTPTEADVRDYLRNKLQEHILKTVELVGVEHREEGVQLVLSHAPLEKFRLLFPLSEPLSLTNIRSRHQEGLKVFAGKAKGLAELVGVEPDKACFDVSRAFYMPSHPRGKKGKLNILRGRPVQFGELKDVVSERHRAFGKGGGKKAEGEVAGMSADRWAVKYAKLFAVEDLIQSEASDKVRTVKGGLTVVECPYDELHGNAGDPEDSACHVADADGHDGFQWRCKHNSCAEFDRIQMLQKAIADDWFDPEVLREGLYYLDIEEEGRDSDDKEPEPCEVVSFEERYEPVKKWLPNSFDMKPTGVWTKGGDEEYWIVQRFDVIGRSSNVSRDAGAGVIIAFENENGVLIETTLKRSELVKDTGSNVIEFLADAGMHMSLNRKAREQTLNLFREIRPTRLVPILLRSGWVSDRGGQLVGFMCPTGEYIGAEVAQVAPYRLEASACVADPEPMGTLTGWKDAAKAAFSDIDGQSANAHWVLAFCGAFAGPLLALSDMEGCGFNLSGDSSLGKTLALRFAASAWATPKDKKGVFSGMSGTTNSIELVAARSSETVYAMDEIGRMQRPDELGPILFNLSSGSGKSRMKGRDSSAGLAEESDFRVFVICSNERSLRTTIVGAGGDYKTGLSTRFPDIDVTGGRRVSSEVIKELEKVQTNFGHAGPAFVRFLLKEGWHQNGGQIRDQIEAAAKGLANPEKPAQLRAAKVFGLLQVAGNLAVEGGLLPDKGVIARAVKEGWEAFLGSDEGKATEGEVSLIDGFRSWLSLHFYKVLIDADAREEHRGPNAIGWFTDDLIVLADHALRDIKSMGLSGTKKGLLKALNAEGVLIQSGKNNAHNHLPAGIAGGEVKNYRIDRKKLGLQDIEKGRPLI